MLGETLDQIMAHRPRSHRRVERQLDGMAFCGTDPNRKGIRTAVLTAQDDDFRVGVGLIEDTIHLVFDEPLIWARMAAGSRL